MSDEMSLPALQFDHFLTYREVDDFCRALCEAAFRRVARLRIETGDPTSMETLVAAYRNFSASAWVQFFLDYDPRPALAALKCPVLALNGELDLQVDCDQNLPEIQRAIRGAGGDVATIRYEGLNHLFQPSKTGDIGECLRNEVTFDKRVLADMMKWLRQKLRPQDGA